MGKNAIERRQSDTLLGDRSEDGSGWVPWSGQGAKEKGQLLETVALQFEE